MKRLPLPVTLISALLLSGCSHDLYSHLPNRDAAYKIIPEVAPADDKSPFLLTIGDELTLNAIDEPDLNIQKLVVDNLGNIQVPLIGSVVADGRSIDDVSHEIERRLGAKYIRDPHIAINVTTPVQRTVSVEGQVTKAGVYPATRDTTLLSAVAMAESTSKNARLDEVVVFRTLKGERTAARFDLDRIRSGVDPDPQLLPGDTVVVGFSHAKAIYHDFLTAAPFFNVFTRF